MKALLMSIFFIFLFFHSFSQQKINVPDGDIFFYNTDNRSLVNIKHMHQAAGPQAQNKVDTTAWIFIPNSFSPNGDGVNDLFLIRGSNIVSFRLQIFSRFAQMVYESDNIFTGWDGTNLKKWKLDGAKYTYLIKGTFANNRSFVKAGEFVLVD